MGCIFEHNCLLVLSDDQMSSIAVNEGSSFSVEKDGKRLYPVGVPIEFCDKNYKYVGKLVVKKLSVSTGTTLLECQVVKVFSETESKVFSENFISIDQVS